MRINTNQMCGHKRTAFTDTPAVVLLLLLLAFIIIIFITITSYHKKTREERRGGLRHGIPHLPTQGNNRKSSFFILSLVCPSTKPFAGQVWLLCSEEARSWERDLSLVQEPRIPNKGHSRSHARTTTAARYTQPNPIQITLSSCLLDSYTLLIESQQANLILPPPLGCSLLHTTSDVVASPRGGVSAPPAPFWRPDSEVTCCQACTTKFTFVNRRVSTQYRPLSGNVCDTQHSVLFLPSFPSFCCDVVI